MEGLNRVVWVFNGENSRFPAGVFTSKEDAEEFIKKYSLSGVLTQYPLNEGAYDWAVKTGVFSPKKESENTAVFIQKFTSASQEHLHYEDGNVD